MFLFCCRRGEEHSFIIKPAISAWKNINAQDGKSAQSSSQILLKNTSSSHVSSKIVEKENISTTDHYAIMVSCHSNYTGTCGVLRHSSIQRIVGVSLNLSVLFYFCFVSLLFMV